MGNRELQKGNIIILCEGTKTEYQYFCSVRNYLMKTGANRFSDFKVVPVAEEMATPPTQRKKRGLKQGDGTLDLSLCYYCLQEESAELYNMYKAFPVRFVRETKLYMERFRYQTGWTVYDHDNHPERKKAAELAVLWGVKVAFSSRCFEEWLLMHFERNDTVFSASICKTADGKDKRCGTGIADDCHGAVCIGGRLREKGYIPDYDKNNVSELFENFTLPRFSLCLVNTAWLNHLEEGVPYYERTRYTNVDELLKFLLDSNLRVEWKEVGNSISFRGTFLCLRTESNHYIMENSGNRSCIIKDLLAYYNTDFQQISLATDVSLLNPKQTVELYPKPDDASLVSLKDGTRTIIFSL